MSILHPPASWMNGTSSAGLLWLATMCTVATSPLLAFLSAACFEAVLGQRRFGNLRHHVVDLLGVLGLVLAGGGFGVAFGRDGVLRLLGAFLDRLARLLRAVLDRFAGPLDGVRLIGGRILGKHVSAKRQSAGGNNSEIP